MIPTLLLVGLVVGAFVHDRASLARSATIGAAVSVLWGLGVGVNSGSIAIFYEGAVLGFANVVVGTAVAAGVRSITSLIVGTRHSPSS